MARYRQKPATLTDFISSVEGRVSKVERTTRLNIVSTSSTTMSSLEITDSYGDTIVADDLQSGGLRAPTIPVSWVDDTTTYKSTTSTSLQTLARATFHWYHSMSRIITEVTCPSGSLGLLTLTAYTIPYPNEKVLQEVQFDPVAVGNPIYMYAHTQRSFAAQGFVQDPGNLDWVDFGVDHITGETVNLTMYLSLVSGAGPVTARVIAWENIGSYPMQ